MSHAAAPSSSSSSSSSSTAGTKPTKDQIEKLLRALKNVNPDNQNYTSLTDKLINDLLNKLRKSGHIGITGTEGGQVQSGKGCFTLGKLSEREFLKLLVKAAIAGVNNDHVVVEQKITEAHEDVLDFTVTISSGTGITGHDASNSPISPITNIVFRCTSDGKTIMSCWPVK